MSGRISLLPYKLKEQHLFKSLKTNPVSSFYTGDLVSPGAYLDKPARIAGLSVYSYGDYARFRVRHCRS